MEKFERKLGKDGNKSEKNGEEWEVGEFLDRIFKMKAQKRGWLSRITENHHPTDDIY